MLRRRSVDLQVNHERWLISYSDFITLLFAFFVVMYSISQVNESKYRLLSDTLVNAFHTEPPRSLKPVQVGSPSVTATSSVIPGGEPTDTDMVIESLTGKTGELPVLAEYFEHRFSDLIEENAISVNSNELWLQIELKSNILFPVASAKPGLRALAIFDEIAGILKDYDNSVQVEGYTDSQPINNRRYPSNWELSGARAAAVVRLLVAGGVAPQQLSAVGFGQYHPVADNHSEQGRSQNRRVVLMIAKERSPRPLTQLVLSGNTSRSAATSADPGHLKQTSVLPTVGETIPITTQDGELLFSSDPELPREN